jgi:nucleoside-triphosphatase THEP1
VQRNGLIYVVTGEKGSGKSTLCARVARAAAKNGLTVGGVLTERSDTEDLASPRRVINLRTGESRLFGSQARGGARPPRQDGTRGAIADRTGAADPLTPGWGFDSGVFEWVTGFLRHATPCDLLVIDELGPLELLGGRGWAAALEVVQSRAYDIALVVCRPELVALLRNRLDPVPVASVEVTPQGRDELPGAILAGLAVSQEPIDGMQTE